MHTRNETLLQMYGEKSEQAEELRLDLIDVKEMYRQQASEGIAGSRHLHVFISAHNAFSLATDPRPGARERSRLALAQQN